MMSIALISWRWTGWSSLNNHSVSCNGPGNRWEALVPSGAWAIAAWRCLLRQRQWRKPHHYGDGRKEDVGRLRIALAGSRCSSRRRASRERWSISTLVALHHQRSVLDMIILHAATPGLQAEGVRQMAGAAEEACEPFHIGRNFRLVGFTFNRKEDFKPHQSP